MKATNTLAAFLLIVVGCATTENIADTTVLQQVSKLPSLTGKTDYLTSPFVTAGNRVYIIGHQDGSFPALGWHIDGEMGGVWNHPIKLLDGFTATLQIQNSDELWCLTHADNFINFPIANSHHFTWAQHQVEVDRTQFIPDDTEGAVVEYLISNRGKEKKELQFSFTGVTDLRPTWLGERTNMTDAADEIAYDKSLGVVIGKDKNNPWYALFGSSLTGTFTTSLQACEEPIRNGTGARGTLTFAITLKPNEAVAIPIYIAGSYQSETALRETYTTLKSNYHKKLAEKINRYEAITKTSQLTIPDKNIEIMYEWLKYNTDWLVRAVPEHGVGISAGLPDYPWWFGTDATYALQGVLATGDHELARNTILLIHKLSTLTNTNGRIIHEVSTNGAVFNKGNVNETAQFITLVYNYYLWTGDLDLVKQLFPDLKKGINWLLTERDPDGNLYPNGSGMMEIPGLESELEMIDVAAYTQQALASAAALAQAIGELDTAAQYQKLADELKIKINTEWWQADENSFGDFRGSVHEAMSILKAAMIRCDTLNKSWAVAELKATEMRMKKYAADKKMPHVIYHNWVVNTPLETGIASPDKAAAALQKAKTYENAYGVFVTGIDRTNEPDSVVLKSRKKTFSYTGAVMTLPTGVQAVSAARYGDPDTALEYLAKLHQSFSYALPGSMYEVSPDFGMITQAWNIYGVAVPIVNYFFGIHPQAFEKTIVLTPDLPAAWKTASIENVKIGHNSISINITRAADHIDYRMQQTHGDWTILFNITGAKKIIVNNQVVDLNTIENNYLKLTGNTTHLMVY